MFSRAAVRATTQVAGRRGFHATRSQMSSPYHYPEGPYTNIPFNTKAKTFPLLFWGYCTLGFGTPFMIASASPDSLATIRTGWLTILVCSLADIQAQGLDPHVAAFYNTGKLPCQGLLEYAVNGKGETLRWIDLTIDAFSNSISFVSPDLWPNTAPSSSFGNDVTQWQQRDPKVAFFDLQDLSPAKDDGPFV